MNQSLLKTEIPSVLATIPSGQVFVLGGPNTSVWNITNSMQFIFALGKQFGKEQIVNALCMDEPAFWDCFACKITNKSSDSLLISDKECLVEMLCNLWGEDFDIVKGTIKIANRYNGFIIDGVEHPLCIPVAYPSVASIEEETDTISSFSFIAAPTRDSVTSALETSIMDIVSYGIKITPEDVVMLFDKMRAKIKDYHLVIDIHKKRVYPKWIISRCDICLEDEDGNTYPLKMGAYEKSLYLTFLLFEDGIEINQVPESKAFYSIFKTIYLNMPGRKDDVPDGFNFDDKYNETLFNQKISNIRKSVMKVTTNKKVIQQFAVEGDRGTPVGVEGATDEHRKIVREMFGL